MHWLIAIMGTKVYNNVSFSHTTFEMSFLHKQIHTGLKHLKNSILQVHVAEDGHAVNGGMESCKWEVTRFVMILLLFYKY